MECHCPLALPSTRWGSQRTGWEGPCGCALGPSSATFNHPLTLALEAERRLLRYSWGGRSDTRQCRQMCGLRAGWAVQGGHHGRQTGGREGVGHLTIADELVNTSSSWLLPPPTVQSSRLLPGVHRTGRTHCPKTPPPGDTATPDPGCQPLLLTSANYTGAPETGRDRRGLAL